MGENIVKTIQHTIHDQRRTSKIKAYQQQLLSILAELQEIDAKDKQLSSKYNNYFAQLKSTTELANASSTLRALKTGVAQASINYQNIIKKLFILEHEIMNYLTKGQSATSTYAIYYETDLSSGQMMRGEISAKELYEDSDALTVSAGGISLSRSNVLKLFQNRGKVTSYSTSGVYEGLAAEAIARIEQVVALLDEEFAAASKEIEEKKNEILDEDLRTHMGEKKWRQYQRLKTVNNSQSTLKAIYQRYILQYAHPNGPPLRGLPVNRGHLVEAFERFLSEDFSGGVTAADLSRLLTESMGNLAWFAGGDVGSTQVKSLFRGLSNNKYSQDPSVKVASMESILALANELLQILTAESLWDNKVNEWIENKVQKQMIQNQVNAKATKEKDKYAKQVGEKLIKENLKFS